MKISYNWLKDIIAIDLPAQSLADKLTMAGLEVTSCQQKGTDWVLEIEVTSNRPDWLSHLGIAREVAAIAAVKLNIPAVYSSQFTVHSQKKKKIRGPSTMDHGRVSINIEDKIGCPLYTALIVDNISPGSLQSYISERLATIDVRNVSALVDITNYILFEVGQPMHAFDLDKILKRSSLDCARDSLRSPVEIIVRKARQGEKIITIDGIERQLSPDNLVIADKLGPIAVAGVMGGKDTEVDASTKRVLLESAYFNPIIIRRSRQKLALTSESSYRFERAVHIPTVICAQQRAVELIKAFSPGARFSQLYSLGKAPAKEATKINFDLSLVNKVLGLELSSAKISDILQRLGLKVHKKARGYLALTVPDFRPDLVIAQDCLEEIARIHGFDKIPVTLPRLQVQVGPGDNSQREEAIAKIKNTLCACGFFEVITYSLTSLEKLRSANQNLASAVPIANPLSKEQAMLRTSVLPGLLEAASYNFNHSEDEVYIFEVGAIFRSSNNEVKEEESLGILSCGSAIADWYRQADLKAKRALTFFDLKGVVEVMLNHLGIDSGRINFAHSQESIYAPGQAAAILIDSTPIGSLGKINSGILRQFDIRKEDIWVSLIDLERFLKLLDLKRSFKPFSLLPVSLRDLSFIVKEKIAIGSLKEAILSQRIEFLKSIDLVDEYQGKHIPQGSRGISFSFTFAARERTLTEEEISILLEKIKETLVKNFAVTFR